MLLDLLFERKIEGHHVMFAVGEAIAHLNYLVQRGESQGVKVQLVANVFEAYQLATGKELPQPKGGMRPSLPSKVYDRMRPAASAWLAKVAQYQLQFEALPAEVRRVFQDAVAPAEEHVRAANSAVSTGCSVSSTATMPAEMPRYCE